MAGILRCMSSLREALIKFEKVTKLLPRSYILGGD
jgi:hypothetical protein